MYTDVCVTTLIIIIIFSSSPDIWFDDVDESLINGEDKDPSPQKKPRRNETSKGVTAELITGKCIE